MSASRTDDVFSDMLSNGRDLPWMKRALTDRSYKKFVNCNVPDNSMTNSDLATYGDALLKFALCSILLDRPGHMSVSKSHYESDKTLVTVIGKRYRIMDHLLYDRDDRNIASDYNWSPGSGNEDRRHKHIATAVEAVLGAIYKEHGDMDEIISIAEHWVSVVDEEDRITDAIRQRRSRDSCDQEEHRRRQDRTQGRSSGHLHGRILPEHIPAPHGHRIYGQRQETQSF